MKNQPKDLSVKKGGMYAQYIAGVLCAGAAIMGGVTQVIQQPTAETIFAMLFAAAASVLFFVFAHRRRKRMRQLIDPASVPERKQDVPECKQEFPLVDKTMKWLPACHIAGLPLADGVSCTVDFHSTILSVTGGGTSFSIPYSRITELLVQTETEVQNHFVSSTGGALVGGALFGIAGAALGGRIKKIKDVQRKYFLVVTYLRETDGEVAALMLSINMPHKYMKAVRCVDPYLNKEKRTVRL